MSGSWDVVIFGRRVLLSLSMSFSIFSRAILSGMTFPEFASPESECFILSIVLVLSASTLRASFFLCDLTSCEQQQVSLAHECLLLRRRVMILHFGSKEACRKTWKVPCYTLSVASNSINMAKKGAKKAAAEAPAPKKAMKATSQPVLLTDRQHWQLQKFLCSGV